MAVSKKQTSTNRPYYVEYRKPHDRERGFCCYKDDPCATHAAVLNQLVRMAYGEIEADPKHLQVDAG